MSQYDLIKSKYGTQMILKARNWSNSLTKVFYKHNVKELRLNVSFGWGGGEISFLKDLNALYALEIQTDYLKNTNALHYLNELRYLSVGEGIQDVIEFSYFPFLEDAALTWSDKVESVLNCTSLKKISMHGYKSKDKTLSGFNRLVNLETLCLKCGNVIKIGELSNLKKMDSLDIMRTTQLTSLDGIETLQ